MYKVNKKLYINLDYISSIYRSERNNVWRLVMVGASDKDEFPLTDNEAENIIKAIEIDKAKRQCFNS